MTRAVVLFAREPAREAREKGLPGRAARDFFLRIARGWLCAAKSVGARVVIVAPAEDLGGWRRALAGEDPVLCIAQRGRSFGRRLELAARDIAGLAGRFVVVGGDVAPDATELAAAFAALESGADAVLSPAPDGGVSLISLRPEDLDLLRSIGPRQKDLAASLHGALEGRGRRTVHVGPLPDVDGRSALRGLLRQGAVPSDLALLARAALREGPTPLTAADADVRPPLPAAAADSRAPPLAA